MARVFIVLIITVLMSGCASYMARYNVNTNTRQDDPITPFFSGTVVDIGGAGKALISPVQSTYDEKTPAWLLFTLPLFLIDLPASFIADIFLIPSDIMYINKSDNEAKDEAT